MSQNVVVAGVGMVPFTKPGRGAMYDTMGAEATRLALRDAGIELNDVDQAYVGYVNGDSTSGQRALYEVAPTGIPIFNVSNNCASGSSALYLARQAVASGTADIALALGFEQMERGAIQAKWLDRPSPLQKHAEAIVTKYGMPEGPPAGAAFFFGAAGREYVDDYGMDPATFAHITVKNRRHAAHNPNAVFREPLTVEEVLESPKLHEHITRLQACPPTCGAAAAVVVSPEYAKRHGLRRDVVIAGQSLATDNETSFGGSMKRMIGYDMSQRAATQVYEQSGIGPEDIPVVELHDCFTTNEVLTYEALGLTPEGTAERFILDGQNTYGGKVVVNPSGGLIAKGHPIGATGLAQCAELVWQLRGEAGARQVDGADVALQHNLGLGGAVVVTMYQKVAA